MEGVEVKKFLRRKLAERVMPFYARA